MIRAFAILTLLVSTLAHSDEAIRYVGVAFKNGRNSIRLHCLEAEPDNPGICRKLAFHLHRGKKVFRLHQQDLLRTEIEDEVREVYDLDADDFIMTDMGNALNTNLIYYSGWIAMMGRQTAHPALMTIGPASYVFTIPANILKYPFKLLFNDLSRSKSKRQMHKLAIFDGGTNSFAITPEPVSTIKVNNKAFHNLLTSIQDYKKAEVNYFQEKAFSFVSKTAVMNDVVGYVPPENQFHRIKSIRKYQTSGPVYSSPSVTSSNHVVTGGHDSWVYVLKPDGSLKVKHPTTKWIHASAVTFEDGTASIGSYDGTVFHLNPEGEVLRKFNFGEAIPSSSLIMKNGSFVYGTDHGELFSIQPDGTKQVYKIERMIHGYPVELPGEHILFGANDNKMRKLTKDFKLVWEFETGGIIAHSKPLVLNDGTIVFGSYDKHIYFLNADGTLKYKVPTHGWIHSNPLLAGDTIVIGSNDHNVYFLDLNGQILHTYRTEGKVISSPALLKDGTIAVGSYDKHMYFLSKEGKLLARYKTGGKIWSSPAVLQDGQTVVFGSGDHNIYFIEFKN